MGSLTVQNLASSAMGFVFLASLLHLLPQKQYGIYSAVILSTGIALNFAVLGLNTAATRYFAMLREKDENASWVAARSIFLLCLVFSVIATGVFLAISPYLSLYFVKTESWTGVFLLGGAYLFLVTISSITQGIIQGMKKYVTLAKILFTSRLVMTVLAIALLEFDRSVSMAIVAWLVYYIIILVWSLWIISPKMFRAKGSFDYSKIIKYSLPLGVAAIITTLSSNADQVVVGGYLTPISLGVYNAAVTISSVLGVVLVTPLTLLLLPEASSSAPNTISNTLRLALRFVVLGLLPAALLLTALAPQFLTLFSGGGGYLVGEGSMELITIFYVFTAIQSICLVLLQAIGKTTRVMMVGAIAAATDILVAVSLVPTFGIIGGAMSKIAVALVGSFLAMYLLRDYTKGLKLGFYLKGVVVAVVPFVPIIALSYFVSSRTLTLIPYSIGYALLFLLCMKLTKLLTEEDRTFLSHILPVSIQKFVKYI